ncbi:M23 family metallopeptidase [Bdellovibrio reynosensis]|uniref:M23 family metallopeptidase n=1 Tax=Bdellovibrio reynosensis TaxID=2835041 RepID=A0ABY4CIF4_9BACT|nr:M23 family metallopeptidase [Bdellovibrio reynosensis]UOF02005.1 M23 family metallopeptidase [Bdellovibrio reynosensis]
MSYTQSMSPGWKQLVKLAGCIISVGTLGSCTTFHTPLSREYFAAGSPPPTQSAARNPSSDQSPYIENEMTFDWPVDSARMTRGFLPHKKRPHLGIDLAAPKGTPILASQTGTVIYAGREFRGYGKMVLIESGDGWATLYAHFDKILVVEGQKVRQGEVIGAMGRTGRATGVHLHFEVRKDRGPIDPLPLLPHVPTAGL